MASITTTPPDPYDPAAAAIADELYARMRVMRVAFGQSIAVGSTLGNGRRFRGQLAAVGRLSAEEHAWLTRYAVAADRKRRDDRERARQERRAR